MQKKERSSTTKNFHVSYANFQQRYLGLSLSQAKKIAFLVNAKMKSSIQFVVFMG